MRHATSNTMAQSLCSSTSWLLHHHQPSKPTHRIVFFLEGLHRSPLTFKVIRGIHFKWSDSGYQPICDRALVPPTDRLTRDRSVVRHDQNSIYLTSAIPLAFDSAPSSLRGVRISCRLCRSLVRIEGRMDDTAPNPGCVFGLLGSQVRGRR